MYDIRIPSPISVVLFDEIPYLGTEFRREQVQTLVMTDLPQTFGRHTQELPENTYVKLPHAPMNSVQKY